MTTESQDETVRNHYERLKAGAVRYAAADRSDPFALRRALTHIAHGLCGPLQDGKDGCYDADETAETAITNTGVTFTKTVHRNIARP